MMDGPCGLGAFARRFEVDSRLEDRGWGRSPRESCDQCQKQKRRARAPAPHGLSVDTALADGIGDAIDGQHISCDAIVDAMSLGEADHVLESALHDVLELLVDYGFFPEISLAVLHPLEIRR